jgi:hypothetical protein
MDAIPISTSHSSSTSRFITETPCFLSGGGNSMDGRYDGADVLEVAGCDAHVIIGSVESGSDHSRAYCGE